MSTFISCGLTERDVEDDKDGLDNIWPAGVGVAIGTETCADLSASEPPDESDVTAAEDVIPDVSFVLGAVGTALEPPSTEDLDWSAINYILISEKE